MQFKSEFYKSIDSEFHIIIEREFLSGGNPVTNLQVKMFYLLKHHYDSKEQFDRAIISEITDTLQSLENAIIKKTTSYQKLAHDSYHQNIDAQKWIDFAQSQATMLSYEMYNESELKYLRHFHIVWLTWIYCDEELKKLRIRSSRDMYNSIGKNEKTLIEKRNKYLKRNLNNQ
ncbi:hypothetical protein [Spiroplasma endosymbiont of Labia minor]|uniref:hypothetical protein n=1 Tax=Spiroplasma endosymbiont of Labia minor TaxID=3066305 RepID=UPI0030D58843